MIRTRWYCWLLLVLGTANYSAQAETNWPRWRGPLGTGHSTKTDLPVTWSPTNVAWKTKLLGIGQSSPIVWGDRIFLTSAEDDGATRLLICLDRTDGTEKWKRTLWTGTAEKIHKMNSYASATCATDGKLVFAFFGKGGLHCYDVDGSKQWSRDLGAFEGPWGTAASPILAGDLLIQNCDADDAAYLLAVNKKTGEDVWRVPRFRARGWSTPILVDVGDKQEIVVNGEPGANGYDLKTGKELWFCKGDRGRGTPTITPYKDILIAVNGRPGEMWAFRAGGQGLVNDSHEVWRTPRRSGRDLPSPIVIGDYLFVMNMKGVGTCYDAASGEELNTARIGGNFTASPIAANGLAYITSEEGETIVLRLGKRIEIVARNRVGGSDSEIFRAALTPSGSQLLVRSTNTLYCVGDAE